MSVSSDSTTIAQAATKTQIVSRQPNHDQNYKNNSSPSTMNTLPFLSNYAAEVASDWLLPDGVADVLFEDAQKQELLRHKLTQQLITHGYQLVCPPLIEYTESLLSEASEDLKRQTFKIIDQLTGRLMGVRADITPQILRIDAQHGRDIARYCYAGHVIHTLPAGLFGSRTPLQLGAEIFGCDDIGADFELIDVLFTMVNSLNLADSLHIDLGHVAIFKRLAVMAQLADSDTDQLMSFYANKNLPELKRLSQALPMGEDFYALARFGHDIDSLLSKLSASAQQDEQIVSAIDELQHLATHLQQHWQCTVSIDITELSGYHYHTGIVFNGYINSETQPLVRGGRFDGMQSHDRQLSGVQVSRAATGFSMDISRLLAHIELASPVVVGVDYTAMTQANETRQQALQQSISQYRQQGYRVTVPLNTTDSPADITHRLSLIDGQWQLTAI